MAQPSAKPVQARGPRRTPEQVYQQSMAKANAAKVKMKLGDDPNTAKILRSALALEATKPIGKKDLDALLVQAKEALRKVVQALSS